MSWWKSIFRKFNVLNFNSILLFLLPYRSIHLVKRLLLDISSFLKENQRQETFAGKGRWRHHFYSTSHFGIFSFCYTWCFQARSRDVSYCFRLVLIILHICSFQTASTDMNACTNDKRRVVYKYFRCVQ